MLHPIQTKQQTKRSNQPESTISRPRETDWQTQAHRFGVLRTIICTSSENHTFDASFDFHLPHAFSRITFLSPPARACQAHPANHHLHPKRSAMPWRHSIAEKTGTLWRATTGWHALQLDASSKRTAPTRCHEERHARPPQNAS